MQHGIALPIFLYVGIQFLPVFQWHEAVDAAEQFIGGLCASIGFQVLPSTESGDIVNSGNAVFHGVFAGAFKIGIQFFGGLRRDDTAHQVHRFVFEHAGGLAVCVFDDEAAGGVIGVWGYVGKIQCCRIGEGHMAIVSAEENGPVAGDGIDPVSMG